MAMTYSPIYETNRKNDTCTSPFYADTFSKS